MTASGQLQMFEPEGAKLAELVGTHSRNAAHELKVAANLRLCGYTSAANSRQQMADAAADQAAVCEMALQFEQLAGLS